MYSNVDTNVSTYRIGSGICHRKSAKPIVNDIKVLIFELVAVDTLSTSSVKVGKVSALYTSKYQGKECNIIQGAI